MTVNDEAEGAGATAGLMPGRERPTCDPFADMVEAFCAGQSELRARLARVGGPDGASAPGNGCNGNAVTDNLGGQGDGQA
jgi:hypothetical protein